MFLYDLLYSISSKVYYYNQGLRKAKVFPYIPMKKKNNWVFINTEDISFCYRHID